MENIELQKLARRPELTTQPGSRYRIGGLIGRGSMGEVYRAFDTIQGVPCAIKRLVCAGPLSTEIRRRFIQEAKIIADTFHPHIVRLYEACILADGSPLLVMELLEGQDLLSYLEEKGPLPVGQCITIASQVASALHSLHERGIVHRDIKPQNIFLVRSGQTPDGSEPSVKLIDFGLAKVRAAASSGASEQLVIGTPDYLAPEALTGRNREIDGRLDQWATAIVLFRMLTGKMPFPKQSDPYLKIKQLRSQPPIPIEALLPDIPQSVRNTLQRALRLDKTQRFPTMQDFERSLTGLPPRPSVGVEFAAPASAPPPASPPVAPTLALSPPRAPGANRVLSPPRNPRALPGGRSFSGRTVGVGLLAALVSGLLTHQLLVRVQAAPAAPAVHAPAGTSHQSSGKPEPELDRPSSQAARSEAHTGAPLPSPGGTSAPSVMVSPLPAPVQSPPAEGEVQKVRTKKKGTLRPRKRT